VQLITTVSLPEQLEQETKRGGAANPGSDGKLTLKQRFPWKIGVYSND